MNVKEYIKKSRKIINRKGIIFFLKAISFRILFGPSDISKKKIKKLLSKENPILLEIGAHKGTDTVEFLRLFKSPKIYAFEPDPRNIQELENKFKRNSKVFIEKIAISDKDKFLSFYLSDREDREYSFSSSIKKPKNHLKIFPEIIFQKKIRVRSMKLDSWAKKQKIDFIDFIWADVQGAELELIKGGKETLNKKVKYFYTEYSNSNLYENEANLKEIKKELGNFKVIKIFRGMNSGNVLFVNKRF